MRKLSLVILSLFLCQSGTAFAQMGGGMGGPGGGGDAPESAPAESKPRQPRSLQPVKRSQFDKIVKGMFDEADTNNDGIVTLAELRALIESRRTAIIAARFARIDTDRNGSISKDEFMAWQRQMGSYAAQEAGSTGDRNGPVPEVIMPDRGKNGDDEMIAGMIEPLSSSVIAKANTNYDAGMSLAELLAYEGKIFDAADTDRDGYLTVQEMRPKGGPGGPTMPPPPGARP